jgi:hypothetical protein
MFFIIAPLKSNVRAKSLKARKIGLKWGSAPFARKKARQFLTSEVKF